MASVLDLPIEIVDIIFSGLDQFELWSLSLACRRFKECATPLLYRDVTITDRADFGKPGDLNRLRRFMWTVWSNPWLAAQVRSLKMLDAPVRSSPSLATQQDWKDFSPYLEFPANDKEKGIIIDLETLCDRVLYDGCDYIHQDVNRNDYIKSHLRANSRCCLLGLILNLLNSRLQTLHLDIERMSAGTNISPPRNPLTGCTSDYANLTTLVIRGHDHWIDSNKPDLSAYGWAWISTLKSLTISHCRVSNLELTQGENHANLQHLSITSCTIFGDIAALTSPVLRSLTIEDCEQGPNCDPIASADLEHWLCKDSLECLVLSGIPIEQASFRNFSKLRFLAVPLQDILSLLIPRARQVLTSRLPESLVALHLNECTGLIAPGYEYGYHILALPMVDLVRAHHTGHLRNLEWVEAAICGQECMGSQPPPKLKECRDAITKMFANPTACNIATGDVKPMNFNMVCNCVSAVELRQHCPCRQAGSRECDECASYAVPEVDECWLKNARSIMNNVMSVDH